MSDGIIIILVFVGFLYVEFGFKSLVGIKIKNGSKAFVFFIILSNI